MHLKNWSIGYPDGRNARIAPLYDFVCTRLYYPNAELALTIGGERQFGGVDADAMRTFARAAEISVRRTLVLASELVERLHDTWRTFRDTVPDPNLIAAIERNFGVTPLMRT